MTNYWRKGIKTVAVLVFAKGLVGIVAAILVQSMAHHDMGPLLDRLLELAHLNPDGAVAEWLSNTADKVTSHHGEIAFVGFVYGVLKIVEGVGLWYEKRWAEWLVILSTIFFFIPVEVYELSKKTTLLKAGALMISILIVLFMGSEMRHSYKTRKARG